MKKFDREYFAKHYHSVEDKNPARKIEAYLKVIKRLNLPVREGSTLLDVGCGFGRFLKAAETEFETYGIDPSEFAIGKAKEFAKRTKFEVATILSYNPEIKFHVVTALDVLEHTQNLDESLKRIKSWLFPGGLFVCVVPVYDGPLGWLAGKLDRDETHIYKWSRRQWLRLFQKNFKVLTRWGAVRYSFGALGYFHFAAPWLFSWGQAILVVMRK